MKQRRWILACEAWRSFLFQFSAASTAHPTLQKCELSLSKPPQPRRCVRSSSSRVERPSRSSLVTTTMSPRPILAISLANSGRSARILLAFSRYIVVAPAALSAIAHDTEDWPGYYDKLCALVCRVVAQSDFTAEAKAVLTRRLIEHILELEKWVAKIKTGTKLGSGFMREHWQSIK